MIFKIKKKKYFIYFRYQFEKLRRFGKQTIQKKKH